MVKLIIVDEPKFTFGKVVATSGVNNLCDSDTKFQDFVAKAFSRHCNGDWGDLCEEDKNENESALRNGERLFSKYNYNGDTSIYIITEWDRSVTTILFPSEYQKLMVGQTRSG